MKIEMEITLYHPEYVNTYKEEFSKFFKYFINSFLARNLIKFNHVLYRDILNLTKHKS